MSSVTYPEDHRSYSLLEGVVIEIQDGNTSQYHDKLFIGNTSWIERKTTEAVIFLQEEYELDVCRNYSYPVDFKFSDLHDTARSSGLRIYRVDVAPRTIIVLWRVELFAYYFNKYEGIYMKMRGPQPRESHACAGINPPNRTGGLCTVSSFLTTQFLLETFPQVGSEEPLDDENSLFMTGGKSNGTHWLWMNSFNPTVPFYDAVRNVSLQYTNWAPGEPRQTEGCVYLNRSTFQWLARDCQDRSVVRYVCCDIRYRRTTGSAWHGNVTIQLRHTNPTRTVTETKTKPIAVVRNSTSKRVTTPFPLPYSVPKTQLTSATQQASTGMSALANVAGVISGGLSSKAQVNDMIQTLFLCGTEDKFDLERSSDPLGMPILGSSYLGAAVFNTLIVICINVGVIAAYYIRKRQEEIPGVGLCAVLYFYPPVTYAAFHCVMYGEDVPVVVGGSFALFLAVVVLGWTLYLDRADVGHEPRYWVFYKPYREQRRWFISVELVCQLAFSFITAFRASSTSVCEAQIGSIAGVCLIHMFLLWLCRPFRAVFTGSERFALLIPDMIILTITDALNIATVLALVTMSATDAASTFLFVNNSLLTLYAAGSVGLSAVKRVKRCLLNEPTVEEEEDEQLEKMRSTLSGPNIVLDSPRASYVPFNEAVALENAFSPPRTPTSDDPLNDVIKKKG
eukprot:PhF_6_TR6975/c0_g1_i1/m.10313